MVSECDPYTYTDDVEVNRTNQMQASSFDIMSMCIDELVVLFGSGRYQIGWPTAEVRSQSWCTHVDKHSDSIWRETMVISERRTYQWHRWRSDPWMWENVEDHHSSNCLIHSLTWSNLESMRSGKERFLLFHGDGDLSVVNVIDDQMSRMITSVLDGQVGVWPVRIEMPSSRWSSEYCSFHDTTSVIT